MRLRRPAPKPPGNFPEDREPRTQIVLKVPDADTFRPDPAVEVVTPFEDTHYGTKEMTVRLVKLGYGIPDWLHLVPVDFEASEDWLKQLSAAGFDSSRPAVIVSTGVAMYLTKDATAATLRQITGLAPGSTLAMTSLLPTELLDDADRPGLRTSKEGAQASGTPFISFYTPPEMLALAREAGFENVRHLSGDSLAERYFANRTDGLRPSSGEDLLLATT